MAGGLLDRMTMRLRGQRVATPEDAVLEHLAALLNTRQGSSSLDREYGMPDITDFTHNLPTGIPTLQRMIVDVIQRYEPRLKGIVVRSSILDETALSLSFHISAQLVGGGALRFETKLSSGGLISIT
jgi:type VI secretion system protein